MDPLTIATKTIEIIIIIIKKLYKTSRLIQRINEQTILLEFRLRTLHQMSQKRIIPDENMEEWLHHTNRCNTTLHEIQNKLEDYNQRTLTDGQVVKAAKFQLGPKRKLSTLIKDLGTSMEYFTWFTENVLANAQEIHPSCSLSYQMQGPVMSIAQIEQMEQNEKEADF